MKKMTKWASFSAVFGVAAVLFGSHAGGGFATGNQESQFYVRFGWVAPITAVLAMVLLTATLREAIIMYNNNDCKNYKELFRELWNPYPQLEILWEIYYYLMVTIAVGAVIAASASVFQTLGVNYYLGILIVGVVLLLLTIFGAKVVTSAAGIMSIIILVCCFYIFITGIDIKSAEISTIMSEQQFWYDGSPIVPFLLIFTYAGFQSVVIPTLTASSRQMLRNRKQATWAMFVSFLMNAIALGLAVTMILGWHGDIMAADAAAKAAAEAAGTEAVKIAVPTLFVAQHVGSKVILFAYEISLFLCLMSTGVACIFGMVNRFQDAEKLMFIKSRKGRRIFVTVIIMLVAMSISTTGLSKVVKYGYGYCGHFGIFTIVLPFLTIGAYKNRKFKKEHPEHKWYAQRVLDGEEEAEE